MSCSNRRWGFVSFKQKVPVGTQSLIPVASNTSKCTEYNTIFGAISLFIISVSVFSLFSSFKLIFSLFFCLAPQSALTGSRALSPCPDSPTIFDNSEAFIPLHQAGMSVRDPFPCCMELHPFISKCCQTKQLSNTSHFQAYYRVTS